MNDNEELHEENLLDQEGDIDPSIAPPQEEEEELGVAEEEIGAMEGSRIQIQTSYRFKLTEILKNLHSQELKIYSDASEEFMSLLRSDSGGEILREYVQLSTKCSELLEAWRLHKGKPGMSFILSLISVMLSHPGGRSWPAATRIPLDSFARSVLEDKLEDVYAELNSQEWRRQSAALSVLASIVKRRMGLSSEVAKRFDFKLPVLLKLSGAHKKKAGKDFKHGKSRSTRRAFVEFAMSFLQVGNPRLLRWILQQRDLYFGVLSGLANDDADIVIMVLSTLRDKVLIEDSLIPPALRSVLFGRVTLEQLSLISGNPVAGPAADVAHAVLIMVCTDPQNGLMQGPGLKGNQKRLLEFMRKLKATEVGYHKQLLLAIVKGRDNLCSAYMDEFPYYLEPRPSSSWYSAISLAADLVSSIDTDVAIANIASYSYDQLVASKQKLHGILKCILPRSFTRSVINKGLLHSESLVKHGSLRLVLESLKSLDNLIASIENMIEKSIVRRELGSFGERMATLHYLPGLNFLVHVDKYISDGGNVSSPSAKVRTQDWVALRHYVQNEIRADLPDPQVLLKLLSTSSTKYTSIGVKRAAIFPEAGLKKLKSNKVSENVDIFISGLDTLQTDATSVDLTKVTSSNQGMEVEKDHITIASEIWGLNEKTTFGNKPKDVDNFFHSKLLDVLKFYLRTVPIAFEGSFDFFKFLPANPSSLSIYQQQSLLSLLMECYRQCIGKSHSAGGPESMYKHLHPLINFLKFSQVKDIEGEAYTLVRAAMIGTGAFDQNISEINAWFVFLPGCIKNVGESKDMEALHKQFAIVISFLCDAVSTIGNNLYKYLHQMQELVSGFDDVNDHPVCFSPLIICILKKCLRLLESDSVTFKVYEKSMISLYVGNTLSLILSTQVDMRMLSCLIHMLLCEKFKDNSSVDEGSKSFPCEWRPLKNLFGFVSHMLDKRLCVLHPISDYSIDKSQNSFPSVLLNVEELVKHAQGVCVDGLAHAFTASILCTATDDIMAYLPSVLAIIVEYFPSQLPFLTSVFFLNSKLLVNIRKLWPKMFFSGLELISQAVKCSHGKDFGYLLLSNGVLRSTDSSILAANFAFTDFAASAFCSFLMYSPFYALFSATLSFATWESHSARFLDVFPSKMLKLLQLKISQGSVDESILFLQYVLFWTYHMILLYKEKPSFIISELLQMCITLAQNLMDHLQAVICNQDGLNAVSLSSVGKHSQVIAELIFNHPIVALCTSNPLYFSREFTSEALGNSICSLLTSLKQHIHPMDDCILQLLRKFFNFLVMCSDHSSAETHNAVCMPLVRIQKRLIQKILLSFREKFEHCVMHKNAGPFLSIFYIFRSLMDFISPFDLLELVHWIFCKIENISDHTSSFEFAVSVGFYVADGSFDMLCSLLQEPRLNFQADISLDENIQNFDAYLVPKIFYRILDLALCFNQEQGEICILKLVNAVYSQRCAKPSSAFLPLHVLLSSLIFNCPVKMLRYCLYPTSKIKAKILLLLTEISSVHMSLFGNIFLAIIGYSQSTTGIPNSGCTQGKSKVTSESKYCFSNEDFLLLLPVALSYFISSLYKHGKLGLQPFVKIPTLYSSILLDGFSNWNAFVSKEIFQEDYDEFTIISLEEFNSFFCCSLIGKAVVMLHYFFILNGNSIRKKEQLNLFDNVCPKSSFFDGLLCSSATGLATCSYKESLKVINEVAAKISFMRLLLSPKCSIQSLAASIENAEGMPDKTESVHLNNAKQRFMITLFNTLDQIFKQFPLKVDSSVACCASNCYHVFRILEHIILKEIVYLSKEMHIEIASFPFVNNFIRSSLLHRFEDPVTIKAIRCILVSLSGSNFSFGDVLELLIGHSAFVKIMLCYFAICDSSVFSTCGALLQPLTSVLKLIDVSSSLESFPKKSSPNNSSSKMNSDHYYAEDIKLELVRLLRILFHLIDRNLRTSCFNSKELLSLLLCGYGATLSQTDLEIFHLMHELESIEGPDNGSMAALDYLWGFSALKMREEKTHDMLLPAKFTPDCKTIEERKILFRESIPVDSKVCAVTVLHCCTDRSSTVAPVSLESLLKDMSINAPKIMTTSGKNIIEPYDPLFILRFSIHSLLMGYLEPVEFSRIGLLAVTFASISSPDEAVRKLGYECLGRFSKCLESCQKSKDLLHLQLLLSYIQNGITEAWQKIPAVIAIFAAEASLELLDHSHSHFLTISKFLMCLPRMNLKEIPLFHEFFGSSSIHFRTNRLWILRLLHAGLNLPDDAKLYLRNNILILLLNYSASSLADAEFKIHTLKIIKKYVNLQMLAHQLVKESGLLPWLSSLLLFYGGQLIEHQERPSMEVLKLILEVVTDLLSSCTISEWLQDCALEQLSELSSHLLKLFVGAVKLLKQDISLINAVLTVIASTVRFSQKRKIYQPHFTLSIECLFQLFQAVSNELCSMGYTIELGMHVILLNIPTPVASNVDKARLMKLLTWAIPSASVSILNKRSLTKNLSFDLILHSEEEQTEESLASKLLRWTSASVILGSVLSNPIEIQTSSLTGKENMLAYLKRISTDACEVTESSSSVNDSLAILILHLLDLCSRMSVLPSMVSALCVLLLKAASNSSGIPKYSYCTRLAINGKHKTNDLLAKRNITADGNCFCALLTWRPTDTSSFNATSQPCLFVRCCGYVKLIHALILVLPLTGNVKKYLDENYDAIQSRCSKIRFPTEANPAWRWSFDQPWEDPSLNKSEVELMEEEHACQSLLIIFSNAIGVGESQGFPALSLHDVENSGLFEWERGHSWL